MESSNSTFIIPSQQDILGLIAQVEKLKQAEQDFIKKSFLTAIQREAIDPGRNIPIHLINLYNQDQENFLSNFGLINHYFPLTGSTDKGEFVLNWSDGCIAYYDPDRQDPYPIRCDFDETEFRQFLNQHKDREEQVYWYKHIEPLKIQLDIDLTPLLLFTEGKDCFSMDIRQAIKDQAVKTVKVNIRKLDDVIYELNRIQAVVEKLESQQPASGDLDADKPKDNEAVEIKDENWSKEMSKSEMMAKLGFNSYYKFNNYAEMYSITKVGGNRQSWIIRLDKMDARNREKLEKK